MSTSNLTTNLQYLMQKNSTNIINLADSLAIAPEALAKIKKGELPNPSLKIVIGLAKHFEVSLDTIVFDDLSTLN